MAQSQPTRIFSTLFLLLGLSLLSTCAGLGGNSSNTPSSAVEVSPAKVNVWAGDTLQFSAKVSGVMDQSVAWSVNGTVGDSVTVGKISTTGLYTAPAALPTPNSVTIEATSASNKSLSGTRAISLENPIHEIRFGNRVNRNRNRNHGAERDVGPGHSREPGPGDDDFRARFSSSRWVASTRTPIN